MPGVDPSMERGHDVRAGMSLALGVLLKYMPVVLLPFLALDRGRLRTRFLQVAVVSIALGLAYELLLCRGPSTLSPLGFAARPEGGPAVDLPVPSRP